VALHEKVDPAVLGGASIRIGDRVIDRTLRTRLNALRRRLESQETEFTKR
jgi:F-type H+-transporting ATPase subunit delta